MDKMKINDTKTEFLILGMKQQHNKVNINGDIVFDVVNPFTAKGFPIDEENRLALDKVKSISALRVSVKTLFVGDSAVAPAAIAWNQGVLFDENRTLLPHINHTCRTAIYEIRIKATACTKCCS